MKACGVAGPICCVQPWSKQARSHAITTIDALVAPRDTLEGCRTMIARGSSERWSRVGKCGRSSELAVRVGNKRGQRLGDPGFDHALVLSAVKRSLCVSLALGRQQTPLLKAFTIWHGLPMLVDKLSFCIVLTLSRAFYGCFRLGLGYKGSGTRLMRHHTSMMARLFPTTFLIISDSFYLLF